MRTAYCPKTHTWLAFASVGTPYGHVPGHNYDDVDVCISEARNGRYRVHVVQSWGSAQGYDEEHGRIEIIGRGASLQSALDDAHYRASDTEMNQSWLGQSMIKAEDEAEEALADMADG